MTARSRLHAGELFIIPAHVPHSAEALEDTVDIDFFAPRREDWINKTDDYFRAAPVARARAPKRKIKWTSD